MQVFLSINVHMNIKYNYITKQMLKNFIELNVKASCFIEQIKI